MADDPESELVLVRTRAKFTNEDAAALWHRIVATRDEVSAPIGNVFINLSGNKLTSLEFLCLPFAHGLVHMIVAENALTSLASLSLTNVVSLDASSRWSMGGNRIPEFDAPPEAIESLLELNLSCVGLRSLGLGLPRTLESLLLHNNELAGLPDELEEMHGLRTLVLSSNRIEAGGIRALPRSLQHLELSDNPLGELPLALGGLDELLTLGIGNCSLGDLDSRLLVSCRQLRRIAAPANGIVDVDPALLGMPSLRSLELSDNPCASDHAAITRLIAGASPDLRLYLDGGGDGAGEGEEDSDASDDADFCVGCGLRTPEAILLLCDGCDASWHPECARVDAIPDGDWFCPLCCGTVPLN
eukprot:Amastigsp_a339698_90.p1 type:complete len:358 gc:universal Amastigsp_a339698_90:32-1105(+)